MAETNLVSHAILDLTSYIERVVDFEESAMVTIDRAHHKVHEGDFYSVVRSTIVVASTNFANVLLPKTTHATGKDRHCTIDVSASNSGIFYLLENTGSTKAAGGTTLTPINHKRNSTNASYFKAQLAPATKNAGTALYSIYLGGNSPSVKIGASGGTRDEYILKSSQDYLLRFDPENANTNVIYVTSWYETTQGM